MDIGENMEIKTLEEAINFNNDNIFEHINFLQFSQNANFSGEDADKKVDEINTFLQNHDFSFEICSEVNDKVLQALNYTSDYAYKSGFREAIRLIKTLYSM